MMPGEELRVAGQGGPRRRTGNRATSTSSCAPGPIRSSPEGRDIHVDLPVSIFRVLAGGVVDVPTLNGVQEALLPNSTAERSGCRCRLPARGRRHAGDLVAHLQVHYPVS
jgi:DnaJ-class molecular chaperone